MPSGRLSDVPTIPNLPRKTPDALYTDDLAAREAEVGEVIGGDVAFEIEIVEGIHVLIEDGHDLFVAGWTRAGVELVDRSLALGPSEDRPRTDIGLSLQGTLVPIVP